MAQLEDTDLLLVQRSDQTHKMTGADLKASVSGGGGGGSVDSVNDVGPDVDGNVELTPGDIGASKPGDNITDFSNNAGYITAASVPPPPVKRLVAGDGIALSPSDGLGEVTITNTKPSSGGGGGGSVESVNNKAPDADGNVQLDATDVGALPDTTPLNFVTSVNGDSGPEVTLTAADVGALPDTTSLDFVPMGSWDAIGELS